MDFNFYMPVRLYSGEGCLRRGGEQLRSLGRRCLVVTGAHAAKACGALDDALSALDEAGVAATVFPGIGENPLLSQCQAAAFAAEACRAEFLLGVGGGSVMDATKAAAWLAANNITDGYKLFTGLRHRALPFALAGTTAGTGSEVSATAVITLDREKHKKSVNDPQCYARVAFCDPRYTHTMSRETTISTALDALSHAVEGWFAPACGDVVTACGEKALPLITEGLRWLAGETGLPDGGLREKLYYGSLWAGLVLNACGTAFPHPLGYVLTEDFQLPHGMACAVFLPAFTRRAEQYAPARAAALFALCGGRESYYGLLDALARTREIRMTSEQVASYAGRWAGLKNFSRTPGGFTPEEAAALYRELFVK